MKRKLFALSVMSASVFCAGCRMLPFSDGGDENNNGGVKVETTSAVETRNGETPDAGDVSEGVKTTESMEDASIEYTGKYLGISDYGSVNIQDVDDFEYLFEIDGKRTMFKISDSKSNGYSIQNKLKEGYIFDLTVKNGNLLNVAQKNTENRLAHESRVKGNHGERTLKNFLTTALMPVGNTLYIYGGGWNWQDEGASLQAASIGVSPDWTDFFDAHDAGYTYKDKDGNSSNADPSSSYYPYGKFIEYYYAGLDCSGYLGWSLYNTFETEDGKDGYVYPSTENSFRLADRGWGDFSRVVPDTDKREENSVDPGDVVSIKGHVWISLGTCRDGSVVIAHSSPSFSRLGQPGGGVQIAALGNSRDCAAYRLADKFMSEYYPEWYERYETDLKPHSVYFDFRDDDAGIFSWHTDGRNGGLTDPDDMKNMDPKKVLNSIYKGRH